MTQMPLRDLARTVQENKQPEKQPRRADPVLKPARRLLYASLDTKEEKQRNLEQALADILCEAFLPEHFIATLMERYPATACAFCEHEVCACPADALPRNRSASITSTLEQYLWSLADWEQLIRRRYGHRYQQLDSPTAATRLITEGYKLAMTERGSQTFYRALADCLRCTIELAAVWDIELTKAPARAQP